MSTPHWKDGHSKTGEQPSFNDLYVWNRYVNGDELLKCKNCFAKRKQFYRQKNQEGRQIYNRQIRGILKIIKELRDKDEVEVSTLKKRSLIDLHRTKSQMDYMEDLYNYYELRYQVCLSIICDNRMLESRYKDRLVSKVPSLKQYFGSSRIKVY